MRGMRRRVGPLAVVVAVVVAVSLGAGCAAGQSGTADDEAAPRSTTTWPVRPSPPARKAAEPLAASPAAPATSPVPTTAPAPPSVTVDVAIGPTSTVVSAPVHEPADADPFGSFAACSAWRAMPGNWSLQVSDPGQDVTAVSILTGEEVTGPGTFDASFRVEFVNGAALGGTGALTLEPDLQSGSFAATDADLSGSFECLGGSPSAPREQGPGVELFALLRRGTAERIVNLDEPYRPGTTACSTADGVEIAGDGGLGADVAVRIGGDTVELRLGATALALDPAQTRVQIDGTAGSFHAVTTDGLEIDGAFTCA